MYIDFQVWMLSHGWPSTFACEFQPDLTPLLKEKSTESLPVLTGITRGRPVSIWLQTGPETLVSFFVVKL